MKNYKEKQINRYFLIIVIIGLFAYYLGIANMYIWIFILLIRVSNFNRTELGFLSLLIGTGLFGRMIPSKEIYLGTVVVFTSLGIILLLKEIFYVVRAYLHSFLFLFFICLFFLFAFLAGPQTDYSYEKITKTSVRFILWTIVFLIYIKTKSISNKRLGIAFLILTLFYLSECYQLYGVRPSSFFDTTFFRDYCLQIGRDENNTAVVNYHTLAYLSLSSVVFWTLNKSFYKGDERNAYIIGFISFWIIAISGARQVIFVFGLLAVIRYILSKGDAVSVSNLLKVFLFIFLFISLISSFGSSYYETALDTNADVGTRLHRDVNTPFIVMSINPYCGVGFGGYPLYANKDYPHNFFLEIICEEGFVGLFIFLLIILFFVITNENKKYFRYMTFNKSYLFVLLLLFFARAQISGDLTSSVSFLAILLSFVKNKSSRLIRLLSLR